MEKLNEKTKSKIPNIPAQNTAKQTYEPPNATFIPLKLDERLMACDKVRGTANWDCFFLIDRS